MVGMISYVTEVVRLLNQPGKWDFNGAGQLYAGVDIGTFKIIIVVVDEKGRPRAAALEEARVVQSGLIVDYAGAVNVVRRLMEQINAHCPMEITKGATSYPPQTESSNINTTRYILEGIGLEVVNILDEPSAANRVLKLKEGIIVDVGGGTTGIAVVKNEKIVYTDDEATGGFHLSLVLAGGLNVSYDKAEKIKTDKSQVKQVIQIVRPVIEKISSIIISSLASFTQVDTICLVGGTCELKGMADVVAKYTGLKVIQPEHTQVITPYGIALSCLQQDQL